MGFGPGAHSDFGGRRYSFVRDLDSYIKGVLHTGSIVDENEPIAQKERSCEYLMLRLRTSRGIEEWEYRRTYFMNFAPLEKKLLEFEAAGLACRNENRWRLTPKGFLLSNYIISSLLELQEPASLADTLSRINENNKPTGQ